MAVGGVGGHPADGVGQELVARSMSFERAVPCGQVEGCNNKRPAFSPSTKVDITAL